MPVWMGHFNWMKTAEFDDNVQNQDKIAKSSSNVHRYSTNVSEIARSLFVSLLPNIIVKANNNIRMEEDLIIIML